MSHRTSENDRLLFLLADHATLGLDARERAELDALLGSEAELESMEHAAAAADLALLLRSGGVGSLEPMPAHVSASIAAEAARFTAGAGRPITASSPPAPTPAPTLAPTLALAQNEGDAPLTAPAPITRPTPSQVSAGAGASAWLGWFAAAACLAIAGSVWLTRPGLPTIAERTNAAPPANDGVVDSIVARADTLSIEWKPLPDETCREQCAGRVIWNNELQRGWMVFKGLAPNDPKQFQYQLWIFDRNQKHPVDGGVFDIAGARANRDGEIVVPIRAAIRVADPQAFAVTIEKPGGVVVSDQTRIAVLAPVSKG